MVIYVAKGLNQFMQASSTHAWPYFVTGLWNPLSSALYFLKVRFCQQRVLYLVSLLYYVPSPVCMYSFESNVTQGGILISVLLPAWAIAARSVRVLGMTQDQLKKESKCGSCTEAVWL